MSAAKAKDDQQNWTLKGSSWEGAWKVFAGIGVLGLAGAGAGYTMDQRRFAFSWLFAFITVLTITLGALFFVLVQRLTSAGWSVTVRRTAEYFSLGVIPLAVLFVPVLLTTNHLFPWFGGEHHGAENAAPAHHGSIELVKPAHAQEHAAPPPVAEGHAAKPADAHDAHGAHGPAGDPHEVIEKEILKSKEPYLNPQFFYIRVFVYFAVWIFLATRLFKLSQDQDKSKDPKLTLKAQALAPAGTFLYGITLTFAAFDWIMSLEPTWFSTIFGVIIFACGVVSSYAVLILVTLALRSAGPLKGAVTIEHYHDLGKLQFGFLVFWAYVQFSQFMLIWYAALPEETTFFHNRWDYEPWKNVSLAILGVHFVIPFFWTISRNFKRNTDRLRIGSAIILVMHVVDMYWYVMPNYLLGKDGFSFHWLDAACLLAVAGVWGAFVFNRMTQHSMVPVGDPRLQRALEFQNA
ncbi:MAG: hypothetical protein KIT84_30290 [Labilithrix sp.]|nr:hypothetical protein [Labilithrix sp.]MCW5815355.1 hypothetical protein [Labilithrix sp.]